MVGIGALHLCCDCLTNAPLHWCLHVFLFTDDGNLVLQADIVPNNCWYWYRCFTIWVANGAGLTDNAGTAVAGQCCSNVASSLLELLVHMSNWMYPVLSLYTDAAGASTIGGGFLIFGGT